MFCFQCQEAAKNFGCDNFGMCGKDPNTSDLQDLLIYVLKGIAIYEEKLKELEGKKIENYDFLMGALFATITNVNFDEERFYTLIEEALDKRENLRRKFFSLYKMKYGKDFEEPLHESAVWIGKRDSFLQKAKEVGVLSTENEDIRSLRELLIYGLKGIGAYAHHALIFGYRKEEIGDFAVEALTSTTKNLSVDQMINLVMKAGEIAVVTMALLDEANTSAYGHPEITEVNIGVRKNPGILVSGHDLRDLADLLEQTKGSGVDVYTHSEMLPAHYYPEFKKYPHFAGNYGGSWWSQNDDFESFNGPIIMTTNCIVPLRKNNTYLDRFYTTGLAGYKGAKHIPDRKEGEQKDFSEVIEQAKKCKPPKEIEKGKIVGGFAHNQVFALADKIVEAVKSGAIKRFVVMAGCDGRQPSRKYYTEVAQNLPKDSVILTAGCAKYRYNKLQLGDIGGIPRVLDAGQCNDSYSLALIALKLKEIFELNNINDLPVSYDIAWYEQKAVTVLLALLYLGVKGIRLGPTLPAFLSPNVAKVLVEKFDIKPISSVSEDISAMMKGH